MSPEQRVAMVTEGINIEVCPLPDLRSVFGMSSREIIHVLTRCPLSEYFGAPPQSLYRSVRSKEGAQQKLLSLIAHHGSLNQLAKVVECENESGSDASSQKASVRIIEQQREQVTVKSLPVAKSICKEEEKVEQMIVRSNQSNELQAKVTSKIK